MGHWNLDSLPWQLFDPSKVDSHLLALAKGASLVESNAADYVTYLHRVFAGDDEILRDIELWGEEEKLHGAALRHWCEMADPTFDYAGSLKRFTDAYRIPLSADASVRGNRGRELIARCIVETGTFTFYTSMRDASEEPVLKEIARRIAGDEIRHFNLFLRHFDRRYGADDQVGRIDRLKTILERASEIDDPELTFAHFAANDGERFDPALFPEYSRRFMAESVRLYERKHFQAMVPLIAKAAGIPIRPWLGSTLGHLISKIFKFRYASKKDQAMANETESRTFNSRLVEN